MNGEVDQAALGQELSTLVSRMRRALRRRASDMPGNLRDLLRAVESSPAISVNEAAAKLHLAPNTVSTMVSELVRQGFIIRDRDPLDARVTRLSLTRAGEKQLVNTRDHRRYLVARALEELPTSAQAELTSALPALRSLVERIEAAATHDDIPESLSREPTRPG